MKKAPNRPLAIDFFCGAGGLSLGFHRAGFNVAAAFDIDPIHVSTYARNFPKSKAVEANVSKLTGTSVRTFAKLAPEEEIDVVYGGPPCQGFSLIGKRDINDPRNLLLKEFARLIAELNPRYFVIENVAGLMVGKPRKVLAQVLSALRNVGYRWVTPIRILNASDFGVPQIRRRVIILGYRKGAPKPAYPRISSRKVTVRDAISDLYALGRCKSLLSSDEFAGKLGEPSAYALKLRGSAPSSGLTGCRVCGHDASVVKRFRNTAPGAAEPVSRFVRLHPSRPAPTLRAGTARDKGSYTAPRPIHPTQDRCITVREAARLHSFPDSFQFHPTQWHGFRQVGNSVPPRLAEAVGRSLFRSLAKKEEGGA